MTAAPFLPVLALIAASVCALPVAATPIRLAQAAEGGGRSIRQIAPEIVAPPTVGTGDLERAAPRAPLSDLGTAAPPALATDPAPVPDGAAGAPARPQIFRPVASAAGRIEADGLTIAIAGIEVLEPEQNCQGNEGEWPCGMVARTAFRSFLRGRALDCDLPDGDLSDRLTASCRLGSQDLGAWLVSNGWAKVSSTGPYASEQAEAVEARRGMFGPGPAPLPPAPVPATEAAPAPSGAAQPPAAGAPGDERAPSVIERRPLPEPKGLY